MPTNDPLRKTLEAHSSSVSNVAIDGCDVSGNVYEGLVKTK